MALFDEVTEVRRRGQGDSGVWDAVLRDEMSIVNGHPNGGYLLSVMGRAAVEAVGEADRHVISATSSYVAAPTIGPVQVEVDVRRRGRTASQVSARLVQDGKTCVESLLLVGPLDDAPPVFGDAPVVEMPSEEECRTARSGPRRLPDGTPAPLSQVIDMDFDPSTIGFTRGEPSGAGELRAWLRFVDDRPVDPLALLFAVDALPPATFDVVMTGWVPTLSLTTYIRALPAPGSLRVRFRVGVIAGGRADEICDVWDSEGRLVAQATQLAALRIPDGALG